MWTSTSLEEFFVWNNEYIKLEQMYQFQIVKLCSFLFEIAVLLKNKSSSVEYYFEFYQDFNQVLKFRIILNWNEFGT